MSRLPLRVEVADKGYRFVGIAEGRNVEEAEVRFFARWEPPAAMPGPAAPPPVPPLATIPAPAHDPGVVGLFPAPATRP